MEGPDVMEPRGIRQRLTVDVRPEPEQGELTLVLSGELDEHGMPTLGDLIVECVKKGHRRLCFDLAEVTKCNEAALYGIAGAQNALQATRGSLRLIEVSEPVRRAFDNTRLDCSMFE
jgi:anti-anti-sigma factor